MVSVDLTFLNEILNNPNFKLGFMVYGGAILIRIALWLIKGSIKDIKGIWMLIFDLEKDSINRKLKTEKKEKGKIDEVEIKSKVYKTALKPKVPKEKREGFFKKLTRRKPREKIKPEEPHIVPSPPKDIEIDENVIKLIEKRVEDRILKQFKEKVEEKPKKKNEGVVDLG